MAAQVATPLSSIGQDAFKVIEKMSGITLPNGFVINGVLGWLDACDDSMTKVDLIRIMSRTYSESEIEAAKNIFLRLQSCSPVALRWSRY